MFWAEYYANVVNPLRAFLSIFGFLSSVFFFNAYGYEHSRKYKIAMLASLLMIVIAILLPSKDLILKFFG